MQYLTRRLYLLGALLVAVALAGCAGVGTVAPELSSQPDTRGADAGADVGSAATDPALGYAGRVTQSSYTGFLRDVLYTHNGANRRGGANHGTQHDLARDAILARFKAFGLTAAVEHSVVSGLPVDNVVAVQTGTSRPKDVYVMSAHYDSVGNPGADDDASGVAAVLEAARVLAKHPSAATVYFIAFDDEELDENGSVGWTHSHATDTIRGMVTVDMIAYNPAGGTHDRARLYARHATAAWEKGMAAAMALYGGLPTQGVTDLDEGDYWAFEQHGWPGCMLIERADDLNKRYHTQKDSFDTPGYLDLAYATKMTRGIVGYFAKMAGFTAVTSGAL